MKIPDISRDPPRDPELAAWFGKLDERADDPDSWEQLRDSIRRRAALPLARLRSRRPWWEYAAHWARPAIPVAAAAGVAFAMLMGNLPAPAAGPETITAGLPFLEEVLAASIPAVELQLLLSGAEEPDALLRMAVQEP